MGTLLTTPASEWIAKQESTLASLSSPVYLPTIVPPAPWTSLSEGGHLVTPEQRPPRLPDDANPDEIEERKRERAEAFKVRISHGLNGFNGWAHLRSV